MKDMKYVVTVDDDGLEEIYIFPNHIDHDRFAEALCCIRTGDGRNWERKYRRPVSAGFTDGDTCYGESMTLELKSRPQDSQML